MKKVIATVDAPKAVGPYSQAIEVNGMVYSSGQIPLDPATGELVEGDVKSLAAYLSLLGKLAKSQLLIRLGQVFRFFTGKLHRNRRKFHFKSHKGIYLLLSQHILFLP